MRMYRWNFCQLQLMFAQYWKIQAHILHRDSDENRLFGSVNTEIRFRILILFLSSYSL